MTAAAHVVESKGDIADIWEPDHVVVDSNAEILSVLRDLREMRDADERRGKRKSPRGARRVAHGAPGRVVPGGAVSVSPNAQHSLPDKGTPEERELRRRWALIRRAQAVCLVHLDLLRTARLMFERPLVAAAVNGAFDPFLDPLTRRDFQVLIAAFQAANVSNSGSLTVGELDTWLTQQTRHFKPAKGKDPHWHLGIETPSLGEAVLVPLTLRLVKASRDHELMPEEWCVYIHNLCTLTDDELAYFMFMSLAMGDQGTAADRGGVDHARGDVRHDDAPWRSRSRRISGVDGPGTVTTASDDVTSLHLNINNIRQRFPALARIDATAKQFGDITAAQSYNTALLRGLGATFHARLGDFSQEEHDADSVLMTSSDWMRVVAAQPEIMGAVFEWRRRLRVLVLGERWWSSRAAAVNAVTKGSKAVVRRKLAEHAAADPASRDMGGSFVVHHNIIAARRISLLKVEEQTAGARIARTLSFGDFEHRGVGVPFSGRYHRPTRSALAPKGSAPAMRRTASGSMGTKEDGRVNRSSVSSAGSSYAGSGSESDVEPVLQLHAARFALSAEGRAKSAPRPLGMRRAGSKRQSDRSTDAAEARAPAAGAAPARKGAIITAVPPSPGTAAFGRIGLFARAGADPATAMPHTMSLVSPSPIGATNSKGSRMFTFDDGDARRGPRARNLVSRPSYMTGRSTAAATPPGMVP